MILTFVPVEHRIAPWREDRTTVAYVICGDEPGAVELRRHEASESAGVERFLTSLARAVARNREENVEARDLRWLRRAVPDQGTSIRFGSPLTVEANSIEDALRTLRVTGPSAKR